MIKRTMADAINQLKEQRCFLRNSCDLYDKGSEWEAKRIALTLRILFHDTNNCKSIFNQLEIKENTKFVNTADPYNSNNLLSSSCLTMFRIESDGKNINHKILPLLDQGPPISPTYEQFSNWWEAITIIRDGKKSFSRKDIVLMVANKDGGGHIDPELPEAYYNLTRNNSMNWFLSVDGVKKPFQDFCLASLRQIGFEVEKVLNDLNIHS